MKRRYFCECGNVAVTAGRKRGATRGACARCLSLDGACSSEFEVIQFLREVGVASTPEIVAELGLSAPRTLYRMRARGQIVAVLSDWNHADLNARGMRRGKTVQSVWSIAG